MRKTGAVFFLVAGVLALASCDRDTHPDATRSENTDRHGGVFVDRAADVGIDFVHFNGMTGDLYIGEVMGAGGGLFDYDNDGDLDAYLVQGHMLAQDKGPDDAIFPPYRSPPLLDRLYRNLLAETGELRFEDVTEAAGIVSAGYGMGVAAADYDRDGLVDLYVTNLGENALFHNEGDGTFREVTSQSGASDERWSTSAAFLDYDRDGWLDLFVVNYVDFTVQRHKTCFSPTSARDYCGPLAYQPYPDRLFRNRGDGTFEDASARAGIVSDYGNGLGVVSADFDADGDPDIYVANDAMPNQLWMNDGDGAFRNEAVLAGCAYNITGQAEASMGVDAGDFDSDGDLDLFMTHLVDESNTLYVNDGSGWFEDRTLEAGLGPASHAYTGFGTVWVDYDNDGRLDVIVVNGAVRTTDRLASAEDPFPLHEPNQLFRNLGSGRMEQVADAGEVFELSEVSRGAAVGDVDNDGDPDVLITNNSGPARLLINEVGSRNHWIGLRLVDETGRIDVLGARVEVTLANGHSRWGWTRSGASYGSSNDSRILFGLGAEDRVGGLRVRWPDGSEEAWSNPAIDAYSTLRRGGGEPIEAE